MEDQKLPSAHQLGDKVTAAFGESGTINNCSILRVHFTPSKVCYDLEVAIPYEGEDNYTRIYNVDSAFVTKG